LRPGERRWVIGGAAVLLAATGFAGVRWSDGESAPPAAKQAAAPPDRPLTAERFGGNLPGAPEVVRVARDGAVWTLLRRGQHTSLARLQGRLLRAVPLAGVEPTDLVEGYRRTSPYLAYSARRSVGFLLKDGTSGGQIEVPGDARDVALDRFGVIWFTDGARSALGIWDRRRLTELPVRARPRPKLEDIVLGGGGSSKLWFLDQRGHVGLADPVGRVLRMFEARGGRPSAGPSRLTGSFNRAAWYTTPTGVGRVTEDGGSRVIVPRLPTAPGALAGGPDGNLWVVARRGPRLFRISPSGAVAGFTLDVPADARLRDLTRDTRRGVLWIASARPRALLRVPLPQLHSKLR
jgi:streptogramin lyase